MKSLPQLWLHRDCSLFVSGIAHQCLEEKESLLVFYTTQLLLEECPKLVILKKKEKKRQHIAKRLGRRDQKINGHNPPQLPNSPLTTHTPSLPSFFGQFNSTNLGFNPCSPIQIHCFRVYKYSRYSQPRKRPTHMR